MAASVIGSVAVTGSTTVTVPSGCTSVLLLVEVFSENGNFNGVNATTLNGSAPDQRVNFDNKGLQGFGEADCSTAAIWYNPSIGSQSFVLTFTSGGIDAGPVGRLIYLQGGNLDSWGDTDFDAWGSQTGALSFSLDTPNASDDLVIALDTRDGSAPNLTTNWTSIGTQTNNGVGARVKSRYGTGSSLTVTSEQENWSTLTAVVIPPAAEGGAEEDGAFAAEANAGAAFSAVATIQAAIAAGVEAGASISGSAAAQGALSAGVSASDTFSGRAQAVASITESLSAGDTDSAINAVGRLLNAEISADAQLQAIADAVAAIQAGLEAGEAWAAIAATEAGLTAGAELGSSFSSDTQSSQTAALAAGTEAASQFLGAVAAFGLLSAGATASDAYAAQASIAAAFTSGAQAGAVFAISTGSDDSITAAVAVQAAFTGAVESISALSAGADIDDAFSSVAVCMASISIGVLLGATFEAQSSADVSIVGASASVAVRSMVASVRVIHGMSATVRNLLAKKASIN